MANTILTPLVITREALRVLHGKTPFLSRVNRQYDNQFAQTGGKIGSTLNIRMPPRYTVRTSATYSGQDHVERSTPFTISSQIGIDISFSTFELTMSLDEFSATKIEAPMSQLAAYLESTCLGLAKNYIGNYNGTTTTSGQMTFKQFDEMGKILTERLAPYADRTVLLDPASRNEFVDATKGLFQDSGAIAKQYIEGMMGRTSGFDVFEDTFLPTHTTGSLAGTPLTTGASLGTSTTSNAWVSQTDLSVDGATSTTTLTAGDIITLGTLASGVVDCHPESKTSRGVLKRYVVQTAVTLTTSATVYTVTVKPGMIIGSGNSYQNAILTKADTDNMTVTLIGNVSTTYGQNIAFHKDAFVFGTVDLEDVAPFGAWSARANLDGFAARIARQWSVSTDVVATRFDMLYGFAPLYNDLAVRHWHTL